MQFARAEGGSCRILLKGVYPAYTTKAKFGKTHKMRKITRFICLLDNNSPRTTPAALLFDCELKTLSKPTQ